MILFRWMRSLWWYINGRCPRCGHHLAQVNQTFWSATDSKTTVTFVHRTCFKCHWED